jgi:hypothetical protein
MNFVVNGKNLSMVCFYIWILYLHFIDTVDIHFVICLDYCGMHFVICKKLSMLLLICIFYMFRLL